MASARRGGGDVVGQRPRRVLIVDDQHPIRVLIRRVLIQHDCEVVAEALTGEDAVLLALEHKPDLVIMDVNMPGMGGIEATKRIRAALPEAVVVGFSSEVDSTAALEAGAAAVFAKHELGRLVATYCDAGPTRRRKMP